jgi:putative transposase
MSLIVPFIKVYIHFVWSTKKRQQFLATPEVRKTVWEHIFDNARKNGIHIDTISGYHDHCHCLVSLGFDQRISETMKLIKGESSYWINLSGLCPAKFAWQDEYYATSVCESALDTLRAYIRNQEAHHATMTFAGEYEHLKKYHSIQPNINSPDL